jgi:mannose-6-phosphate isomerase
MAEVQQTSDATFRLFDWNRKDASGKSRQLHIEEALASIHWDIGPVQPIRAEGYPAPGTMAAGSLNQRLVRCQYFELDYVRQQNPFTVGGAGRLQVAIGLHGQGRLRLPQREEAFAAGHTLVLPAVSEPIRCTPEGSFGVLVATLPDPA